MIARFKQSACEKGQGMYMRNRRVVFLSLALFCLAFSSCIGEEYNTEILRVSSNDSKWATVVFVRNINATTDFSTQISIIGSNQEVGNDKGNIFICDSNHGKAKYIDMNHSYWVKIKWLSSNTVVVQYDKNVKVYLQKNQYRGIDILYEPIDITTINPGTP